jgi:hypothetical protein
MLAFFFMIWASFVRLMLSRLSNFVNLSNDNNTPKTILLYNIKFKMHHLKNTKTCEMRI